MSAHSDHGQEAATIIKSPLTSPLAALGGPPPAAATGASDELYWPLPPHALLTLYRASPEHCRAIHVKSEGAFGRGLKRQRAPGAYEDIAPLEALTEAGSAELFCGLDLDLETFGNAFLQILRAPTDRHILGLRRLPAVTMLRVGRDRFRQRTYDHTGYEKTTDFRPDEVVHLRAPCPSGGFYSLPTWIGGGGMVELVRSAVDYNAAFFANSALPEYMVVTHGQRLTPAQEQTVQTFFRDEFQGIDKSHRTLYLHFADLEAKIEIQRLTAETKEGDFLRLLDAARDRIPIAHGVPPRMLGIVSAGQLGGGGEIAGQFHVFEHLTLAPKRRRLLGQLRPIVIELEIPDPEALLFEPLPLPASETTEAEKKDATAETEAEKADPREELAQQLVKAWAGEA